MTMTISIWQSLQVDMMVLTNLPAMLVGNVWAFFPSASVAWRISKEDFMSSLTFLDDMKIRASVGLLGNDAVSPYAFLSTYNFDGW